MKTVEEESFGILPVARKDSLAEGSNRRMLESEARLCFERFG